MSLDFSLTGRRALVTGASTGIGQAIAVGMAEAGATVVCVDRAACEETVARIAAEGGRAAQVVLDLTKRGAIDKLMAEAGDVDILVNCAGIIRRGDELDPDIFADVVDINLTGSMRVCAAARPLLARSETGAIVNTASVLTFRGGGLVPGYSASKGGIGQLTKSLAIAYADDGIRVNAVAPGWIATPLTQALRDDPARSEPILSRTPMKRWGRPEDVVGGVLFLCSPAAGFVTGAILPIDGGYLTT